MSRSVLPRGEHQQHCAMIVSRQAWVYGTVLRRETNTAWRWSKFPCASSLRLQSSSRSARIGNRSAIIFFVHVPLLCLSNLVVRPSPSTPEPRQTPVRKPTFMSPTSARADEIDIPCRAPRNTASRAAELSVSSFYLRLLHLSYVCRRPLEDMSQNTHAYTNHPKNGYCIADRSIRTAQLGSRTRRRVP